MDWKAYWKGISTNQEDEFLQVQRTSQGKPLSKTQIETYLEYLRKQIKLQQGDVLLDVCCGNGLITNLISGYCKEVIGVDFQPKLIAKAQEGSNENTKYIVADAMETAHKVSGAFDKITILFAIQYFKNQEMQNLLNSLKGLLKPGGSIFIGDIPDKEYQSTFAGTGVKKWKYYIKYWFGKDPTGYFFDRKKITTDMQNLGFSVTILDQPASLPYSSYRFDVLLKPE